MKLFHIVNVVSLEFECIPPLTTTSIASGEAFVMLDFKDLNRLKTIAFKRSLYTHVL